MKVIPLLEAYSIVFEQLKRQELGRVYDMVEETYQVCEAQLNKLSTSQLYGIIKDSRKARSKEEMGAFLEKRTNKGNFQKEGQILKDLLNEDLDNIEEDVDVLLEAVKNRLQKIIGDPNVMPDNNDPFNCFDKTVQDFRSHYFSALRSFKEIE